MLRVVDGKGRSFPPGTIVGPGCVIEENVELGENCTFGANCVLLGPAVIGSGNNFHAMCCIGGAPQDKKVKRGGAVRIGNDNVFREFTTINRATATDGETTVGDRNWVMAYAHVAHECVIGNDIVLANGVQLGGHVIVDNNAVLGGGTLVHQFCRVGKLSFIGGGSVLRQHLPPYSSYTEEIDKISVVPNRKGLKDAKLSTGDIRLIDEAFRDIYLREKKFSEAVAEIKARAAGNMLLGELVNFFAEINRDSNRKNRGIVRPKHLDR